IKGPGTCARHVDSSLGHVAQGYSTRPFGVLVDGRQSFGRSRRNWVILRMAIARLAIEVILDGLCRLGLDGPTLARRAGLPEPLPPQLDERMLEALWREARRQAAHASLPFEVGLHTPEASFGLVYYLTTSAATLGAGLTLLQRSLPLAMPWLRLSIDE